MSIPELTAGRFENNGQHVAADRKRERPAFLKYQAITAAELASANYAVKWIVDDLLVEGQPAGLGGPKKSLKTSIAVALGLSIASGVPFLGRFSIQNRKRVLLCSGESGIAAIQDVARRCCRSMQVELAEQSDFLVSTRLPRMDDLKDMRDFLIFVDDQGAEVVVVDPLYLMLSGGDAGNLFKQGALFRRLSEPCQERGITLVIAHHFRSTRPDPFAVPELDDFAWAGCAEFFRQWILLGRRAAYEPGSGHHALWLTVGGSAGHSSLWGLDIDEGKRSDHGGRTWQITMSTPSDVRGEATRAKQQRKADEAAERENAQLTLDRKSVCRVLAKSQYANGMTKTAIRTRAGISHRRWDGVLATMLDDGDLVECEVVVSNHKTPQTGYRLSKTGAA
jgi:hypothetical protein